MTATRLNTITYAGVAVGGADASQQLHDVHVFEQDYERMRVEFTVVVQHTTPATFRATYQALEAAYRTPNGDLTVNLGGTNVITTSHSSNTGFNARPSIVMLDNEHYTKQSRAYRCSVEIQLPADESGKAGRQAGSYSVVYNPGNLRTLTVSATYTAIGANSATAQAEDAAGFPAWVTAAQTAVSGNWERLNYSLTPRTDEDKVADVQAVYGEVLHRKSLSLFNDTRFVKPQLQIRTVHRSLAALAGSGATPRAYIVAELATQVEKTTTDLKGLISSDLIPLLQAEAQAYTQATGSLVPIESTLVADPHANTITGSIAFSAVSSNLLRATMVVREETSTGRSLAVVLDGNAFTRDLHLLPGAKFREIRLTTEELDVGQSIFAEHEIMGRAKAASGNNWHLIQFSEAGERREEILELPTGDTLRTVVRESVHVLEYGKLDEADAGTRVRSEDRLATGEF